MSILQINSVFDKVTTWIATIQKQHRYLVSSIFFLLLASPLIPLFASRRFEMPLSTMQLAIVLLIMEHMSVRKRGPWSVTKGKMQKFILLLFTVQSYYVARLVFPSSESWIYLFNIFDHLVLLVYFYGGVALFFGNSIPKISSSTLYIAGMTFFHLLSALLPYYFVPFSFLLAPIVFALKGVGVNIKIVSETTLVITKNTGHIIINMRWECMGILSVLIYILVFTSLLIRIEMNRSKKFVFFVLGAFGTFGLNLLRILFILYYYYYVGSYSNLFHYMIGDLLFLSWIIFLLTIASRWTPAGKNSVRDSPS